MQNLRPPEHRIVRRSPFRHRWSRSLLVAVIGAGGMLVTSGGVANGATPERITYESDSVGGDCKERISGIDADGDGALSVAETDYHTLTCIDIRSSIVYFL